MNYFLFFKIVIFPFGTDNPKTASILKSVIDSNLEDGQEPSINGNIIILLLILCMYIIQVLKNFL